MTPSEHSSTWWPSVLILFLSFSYFLFFLYVLFSEGYGCFCVPSFRQLLAAAAIFSSFLHICVLPFSIRAIRFGGIAARTCNLRAFAARKDGVQGAIHLLEGLSGKPSSGPSRSFLARVSSLLDGELELASP